MLTPLLGISLSSPVDCEVHGTLSYCAVTLLLHNPLVFPLMTSGEEENSNFSFLLHLVSGRPVCMSDIQKA